jgi:hypothetical protein
MGSIFNLLLVLLNMLVIFTPSHSAKPFIQVHAFLPQARLYLLAQQRLEEI